jgi:membrane protein YqaA with SNARE-associated domain
MFFVALALCALGGTAIMAFWPELSGLFLFGVYSIPTNSIIPAPHEPGLLYFAKHYDPLLIAVAGTLGTAVAAFADYEVVERAMRHPRIRGAREARLFKWSVRWLMRFPFLTVVLFAATPLPIYVVRVLAPASGYPVARYVTALMVGRLPRFYAVAWFGHTFPLPTWFLATLFAVMVSGLYLGSKVTGNAGLDDTDLAEDGEEIPVPDLTDPEQPKPGVSGTRLPKVELG